MDIDETVMGLVQVVVIDVLPHAARIIPLDFGLQFVKMIQLKGRDGMVQINKELNLGWEG